MTHLEYYTSKTCFVSKIVITKYTSKHYDNLLVAHSGIEKTQELIA